MSAKIVNPRLSGLLLVAVLLGFLLPSGCYKQSFDRETAHGLTNDPYPEAPRRHAASLRVLIWSDVDMKEVLSDFENRYGIKVVVDTFDSDDAGYRLLKEHPAKWDLIMLSQYMGDRMRREGLIQTVPRQNEFIYRYIDTSVVNKKADPEMRYFIPYDYSTLGISFNIDYLAGFPRNWNYVASQKDNGYLYGRVALPDDRRYALAAIMLLDGLDPEKPTQASIDRAKELMLLNIRELGVRFVPYDKIRAEMHNKDTLLAVTWSGTAACILRENPSCRFLLPEGTCIVSVDGFVIPKASEVPQTAALLVEFLLHPYISMQMANSTMYASVNMRTMKYVDRFLINGPSCMISNPDKLIHMRALTPEEQAMYDRAWAEIKAVSIETNRIKLIPIN